MNSSGWSDILSPGERLLWQARPAADIRLADFLSVRLPFGLVFAGFAVFWITAALAMTRQTSGFDVFPLFGVPFFVVGLYMAIGVPIWDAYERSHSWYALSDRAAYVATELFGRRKMVRYPVSHMNALELEDGEVGTVWFRKETRVSTSQNYRANGVSRPRTHVYTTQIVNRRRIRTPYRRPIGTPHLGLSWSGLRRCGRAWFG